MKKIKKILRVWLPLAVVICTLSGLVYVVAQQILRQNANDPQIQMAQDAAAILADPKNESLPIPNEAIDYGKSLAPFLMIFDDSGQLVATSGTLYDIAEVPPEGVLEYVREHGEDRITWQPAPNVRIASVIVRVEGAHPGFVLAGRSLKEIEDRSSKLLIITILAMIVTLLASLALVAALEYLLLRGKKKHQQ